MTDADKKGIIRRLIEAAGDAPGRPGLEDTPDQVLETWKTLFAGYAFHMDDKIRKLPTSKIRTAQLEIVGPIDFISLDERNLLPFFGQVFVGYTPGQWYLPADAMGQIVAGHSRRLHTQHNLTENLADALHTHINTPGAAVVVIGRHLAAPGGGVDGKLARLVTMTFRGSLNADPIRSEFLRCVEASQKGT